MQNQMIVQYKTCRYGDGV